MRRTEALEREVKTLRERLSRLSEASLRINETLDFETVLGGVLDSARVLTGSRYGVMTLRDSTGEILDCVASGMTPEQSRQFWKMPDGMRFFVAFRGIKEPLRLRDFHGHTREMGLPGFRPPIPVGDVLTFLAAPVRHRGESVGNIYLAEKEGGCAFTQEDEDTLVMFASQAALVIANARRYRDEKKAKADLEALINTSPVGVAVFDVSTGRAVSFNREAVRIFENLRTGDHPPEELLEVLTFRRADGRNVSLRDVSLAQALSTGETIRAEEVVFEVPDGRMIRALINATPIYTDDGRVASFVVTLQDMTHLEELERMRAGFLAMVSHELRAPLAAIKGSSTTVLGDAVSLGTSEMVQFFRIIDQQADHMGVLINDLLDVARIQAGTLTINSEAMAVTTLVEQARNTILSGWGRNNIHIELAPALSPVMADRRRIVQVLDNLLSNAARHSPEESPIVVTAVQEGVHVVFSVTDKGRGVAPDRLPHLFQKPSEVDADGADDTGSGLGLAICKGIVEAHGGRIWAESQGVGLGTRVTFTIPIAEDAGHVAPAGPTVSHAQKKGRNRTRILVVDDDPQTLRNVREALSKSGYVPVVTGDPHDVPTLIEEHRPQLVLMDLVLPGIDGIEVMKRILEDTVIPIIFLSAYGHEEAIARAFDAGADDYVIKPFSPTELTARIRAALRKRPAQASPAPLTPFVLGNLTIDYAARKVAVEGHTVRMTDIEYRLLVELSINAGRILTYNYLLERIWLAWGSTDNRRLRSAVKNIRRKLHDEASNPTYIFNEPRVGYRLGMPE